MWIEQRRQQHRVYWRKENGGKDYEAFSDRASAESFRDLCRRYGRDQVLAAHRAQQAGTGATAPATTPPSATKALPALVAGLPTHCGVPLSWLGEQYLTCGSEGNEATLRSYRRDLERYVYPYFEAATDIALIMKSPLPTADGSPWPLPTVAKWKEWLGGQPRHDRDGNPLAGTLLADKTRRNIESLLAQVFTFAEDYDPQPLITRRPCRGLSLAKVDVEESRRTTSTAPWTCSSSSSTWSRRSSR